MKARELGKFVIVVNLSYMPRREVVAKVAPHAERAGVRIAYTKSVVSETEKAIQKGVDVVAVLVIRKTWRVSEEERDLLEKLLKYNRAFIFTSPRWPRRETKLGGIIDLELEQRELQAKFRATLECACP